MSMQLQKLFLVCIAFKLVQKNDSLNTLFKTAMYVTRFHIEPNLTSIARQSEPLSYRCDSTAVAGPLPGRRNYVHRGLFAHEVAYGPRMAEELRLFSACHGHAILDE